MKLEVGKILMAKLARIDHDVAELDARYATICAKRAETWQKISEGEKLVSAEFARIDCDIAELAARRAELGAKRAAVWQELAEGETIDIRVLRRWRVPHMPNIPEPSEADRARARQYLREAEIKRQIKNEKHSRKQATLGTASEVDRARARAALRDIEMRERSFAERPPRKK